MFLIGSFLLITLCFFHSRGFSSKWGSNSLWDYRGGHWEKEVLQWCYWVDKGWKIVKCWNNNSWGGLCINRFDSSNSRCSFNSFNSIDSLNSHCFSRLHSFQFCLSKVCHELVRSFNDFLSIRNILILNLRALNVIIDRGILDMLSLLCSFKLLHKLSFCSSNSIHLGNIKVGNWFSLHVLQSTSLSCVKSNFELGFLLSNRLSVIYIGICNLRSLDIIVDRCKGSVFPLSGSFKSSQEVFFGVKDLRSVLKRSSQNNPKKTEYSQGKNHC